MEALKASILDNDHFRLLAIPFTGPIAGRDMDRQRFTPNTNIYPKLLEERLVDWHHRKDPYMKGTIFGKAILDDEPEDDGWWVEVWLNHGEKRLSTIRRLADEAERRGTGVQIWGSSEALWSKANADGEITEWPYWRQTLSTSPQNTHSVARPAMKAVLEGFDTAGIAVDDRLRSFVADLDALGVDLRSTSLGEDAAKAGRVLANRNEKRLREAIAALTEVMAELDKYTQPDL
jgi:hypothetical protein